MSTLTSVIIPTYRRPERVVRAVESVLAQTDRDWELLVVCDGAQADTETALTPYLGDARIALVTQDHAGVSAARNLGLARARGTWIAFLDDDDLWHPRKLELQKAWMRMNGYLASQTEEIWIRNGKRVNAMRKHAKPSGWIFPKAVERCCVSPSAVMIHRRLFDAVGGFDPGFPVCEDYDLWLRLSLHHPIGCVPAALVTKFGGHADQLSRQSHSLDAWRIRALEKILKDPALDAKPRWREAALSSIAARAKILYQGAAKRGNEAAYRRYQPLATADARYDPPL